ncbi:acyclic terpene utilization AtuA family protein [Saccharopolyspora pogona]|uniref:acyclic terpene utilization AtuA family protein n=1 Tax=Saccharopolyspora pogona TaxID=333966 RepID=UPI0016882DFF|nr:acyclic terpene utilization AtuA family protein [Saccharopolyspora pogona]
MRIGSGAGFAGDRIEPAVDLAARAELDDLVLECLAERTIALGQQRKLRDSALGYDPRLRARFERLLPAAREHGVRIVTNMGAANPLAAGILTRDLLAELGLRGKIAVVTGDDVLDRLDPRIPALEDGIPLADHGAVVSANAYLGAEALLPALDTGADVVLTGRVADPSLFVAPLAHRLGWELDDLSRIAAGTLVGHLLECAGQVTGGYFADPGVKDVPGLAELGFPFAEVAADGTATIGKLADTGGVVSTATVREQLLYEVTDPTGYRTPDVVLDFRGVRAEQAGADRVRISGAAGRARPEELKASVGYRAGYRAECGISYAGPNAARRAQLAADVVTTRLRGTGLRIRADVLGAFGDSGEPADECRLRVAAMAPDPEAADVVCHEVEALYTNGPAGGGGVRADVREVIGIVSALIPRSDVETRVTVLEVDGAAA